MVQLTLATRILIASVIVFGGGAIIGAFISMMQRHLKIVPPDERCSGFNRLVFFVGATERVAAVLLIVFAPVYTAPFVGGWIALKYAANWQPRDAPFARQKSLLALIGTVWSFGFGILAGCIINPTALTYFGMAPHGQ